MITAHKNPIVVLGTSGIKGGKTGAFVGEVMRGKNVPVVDLRDKNIGPFRYDFQEDDYAPLMREIARKHDCLVLASPVYWYTMSGQMKIFIDRLADFLGPLKDRAQEIEGMHVYVLGTYAGLWPDLFAPIFARSLAYMRMTFLGCSLYYYGTDSKLQNLNAAELYRARLHIFGEA